MVYLIVAHKQEASVFFKHFTCKRDKTFSKPLYLHPKFILVITHNGYENASNTTQELFEKFPPSKSDTLINFGICAAPKSYSIGELIHVDTLYYDTKKQVLFDAIPSHSLRCMDSVQSSTTNTLVDMESFGIYEASKNHFLLKNLFFYKLVSDYFEPTSITKALLDTILTAITPTMIKKIQ